MTVLNWLLDGEPAVELATRTNLLGESPDSAACRRLRAEAMHSGSIAAILATQGSDGHWGGKDSFYRAKYTGTVWNLIILAELGADGADPRVERAVTAILSDSQHVASGGFSTDRAKREPGGLGSWVIPCLTGNLVFALERLGFGEDDRVRRAVEWIATYQRFDDAEGEPPVGWPYQLEMCWGSHSCSMGVVKALKGLAEIPGVRRTAGVEQSLCAGTDFLLRHHVHKRSHNLRRLSKPSWRSFGFPRMYQTDVLEIVWILARLGCRDDRMAEAIELIESKRTSDGRWLLDETFNERQSVSIEAKGQPSRWVTLRALESLAILGAGG